MSGFLEAAKSIVGGIVTVRSVEDIKAALEPLTGIITADNTTGAVTRAIIGADATQWADTVEAGKDADAARRALGLDAGPIDGSTVVMDSFASMTHEEMVTRTDAISAASIDAISLAWSGAADILVPAIDTFRTTIATAIETGWEGTAGAAAAGGVQTASENLGGLAESAGTVAGKLAYARIGLDETQRKMPPTGGGNGLTALVGGLLALGDSTIKRGMFEASEQRAEAIAVLENIYAPTVQHADSRLPTLRAAIDPTNGAAAANSAPDQTGPGGTAMSTTTYGDPVGRESASVPASSTADTTTGAEDAPAPGAGAPGAADGATGGPAAEPATTGSRPGTAPTSSDIYTTPTAAAGTATAATSPPTGTVSGTHASMPGSGGHVGGNSGLGNSGVAGYGAGSPGAGGHGSVGGGTAGVPGAVAVPGTPAAAGTATGSVGRPGATGMGMAPAAARGAGGRDDGTEHTTPGYLVTVDNGSDLVGDLPLVAPPVLGT